MMPDLATRVVTRQTHVMQRMEAELVVFGAGISGVSAALEAARLGRRVALIDGAPSLGGQSVGAIVGTFCGLYSNGPNPYQVTHGIADDTCMIWVRRARCTASPVLATPLSYSTTKPPSPAGSKKQCARRKSRCCSVPFCFAYVATAGALAE